MTNLTPTHGWDPNDPILRSPLAPHETAGVLRMHRNGLRGAEVMKILGLRGTKMHHQMQRALDAENAASYSGRPVHNAGIHRNRVE
ncbi:hypothetical protein SEA_KOKO_74 [Mycobacterium phage Koko]|uniref:Gp68-like predicted RNA polymerase component domain-containing protein n=2 Tax=Gladiatorvirus TaxID=2948726 RepID=V5R437_9CAUD|nr:hypothetical protein X820_gp042 [Mycobacterium phage CloudWang3]YP_008858496.1 hypothetical protein X828_gp042 [Mycobacterium phage Artemis2UCLA]YP_010061396.1 hypothetical protein KIP56_gp040 [Mycobacterium phage Koko]QAY14238.1 hypothetical protein SEA_HEXAMO_72 [Mycobacterium phage Hexamo]AHB29863.1 hypothetical protein CLOUDWANG3_73 [Mycobacterium phage CloudWang3]AHB29965.1 hypothetical protein ARTEMIS2UCLA_72 [Mycobacterium phage Artemis2UCLA]ATW60364.1 hypothetical protein SEA_KOKO_